MFILKLINLKIVILHSRSKGLLSSIAYLMLLDFFLSLKMFFFKNILSKHYDIHVLKHMIKFSELKNCSNFGPGPFQNLDTPVPKMWPIITQDVGISINSVYVPRVDWKTT